MPMRIRTMMACALMLLIFPSTEIGATPLGLDIIKRQWDLNAGYRDDTVTGEMIIGKNERTEAQYRFTLARLEGDEQRGTRVLIKIESPPDLRGTALLSVQNLEGRDDQWIYLPALKSLKRVAATSRKGRFADSELTYEDLLPPRLGDESYELIQTVPCKEQTCYLIAATPMGPSQYKRKLIWIEKDRLITQKIECYDKREILTKRMVFSDYHASGAQPGTLRPHFIQVYNLTNQRFTNLSVKDLKIGTGLTPGDFTKDRLLP